MSLFSSTSTSQLSKSCKVGEIDGLVRLRVGVYVNILVYLSLVLSLNAIDKSNLRC